MLQIKNAGIADIPVIRGLAQLIWPETYRELLSPDQLQYMLELIYSETSLRNQFENLHHKFILAHSEGTDTGFASYAPKQPGIDEVYHLHKIYVSTGEQGKGTGRLILDHIIAEIKKAGARALELHVKRDNPAIGFYEKLGFTIKEEIDTNIGNGYFMRDYVMRKEL